MFTGVLGKRIRKNYIKIPLDLRREIIDFYLDDANTMLCSGIIECISVKKPGESSEKIQKRLVLYDLKDLYKNWIEKTQSKVIPCFAFFVSLKPTECLTAGKPGTHNICVCAAHQNFKLKLASVRSDLHYKQLIEFGVCSTEKEKCMLYSCSDCKTKDNIKLFLRSDINVEDTKIIHYMQWTQDTKDDEKLKRISLIEFSEPLDKVLDSLLDDFEKLKEHHFIANQQSDYYAFSRKHFENNNGVLTMDFAENYAFISQNSTQGFYFNNTSASLFTVVLYYKEENGESVKKQSFCVISNSSVHQAYSVNAFLEPVLQEIKQKYPWIKILKYFSDGAPTQFKNK